MFNHVTVLLNEAVEGLNVKPDGIYVDCTLGGAGHSSLILKQLTTGHLYCFDQDIHAIEAARERLEKIGNQFTIIQSNFKNLKSELHLRGVEHVDGILFDLGVSSPQFDDGDRGFSYNYDARLDMRMNQEASLDAHYIVNHYSYEQLVEILYKYADEKFAKQIARKSEKEREIHPIDTTFQLVDIIKEAIPAYVRRKGGHPAKRTFQALRIAVNDELNVFDENMRAICKAAAKVRTPFRHTTQEQIREAMKEKKNARKLVEQYAPTRELDVMAIVARNQLVEKQFTEGEHTKTIENINPVLSENSKILEESTKQRRTSREENLLGKLMEASNQ